MAFQTEDLGPLLAEQLRQQMNNLAAAVQLLTPVVQEKGGAQYDPYLAILHQSLYRMMRMVGNLEYLELPEEDTPLRETTLDLAGMCRELGRQVSALAELAGVAFTWEEEDGSLLTHGDAAQLRRMLLNLISNALRAAGEGGRAGMRLARRDGRAVITVWDSGAALRRRPTRTPCSSGRGAWAWACGWPAASPRPTGAPLWFSSRRGGAPAPSSLSPSGRRRRARC